MELSERRALTYRGTILPTATLSSELDLAGASAVGLIVTTSMTLGTLGFMVSDKPDAQSGVYRDLKGSDGANVAVGPVSGTFAVSGAVLAALKGYRYVRIKTSSAQASGLAVELPGIA